MSTGHSKCKICGEQHRLGAEYCPALKSSGEVVESRHKAGVVPEQPVHSIGSEHRVRKERNRLQDGIAPISPEAKAIVRKATPEEERMFKPIIDIFEKARKRGRPRIGEKREKPWVAAGVSERTWYRRQKEKN